MAGSGSRWPRPIGGETPAVPLIIGHRGASALETENTAPAFARAAQDGADGVELDVLTCATGEVVVFHDDDLVRLAGRPERVADMRWSALREVELARGERVPTLEDAFAACGPSLLVNVELKSEGLWDARVPALVEGVSTVLDRCGVADRVLVSSFDPRAVLLWQRRRPDVPAALLLEGGAWISALKALTLPLLRPGAFHPEARLCTGALIDRWHARGYAVNVWTVDAPGALRALAALGVDGLITNDPGAARLALSG